MYLTPFSFFVAPLADPPCRSPPPPCAQPSAWMRDGPLPRLDLPNVPQHIVQRGNDRQPCFAGPADYQNYRQELWEAAHKHGCALHAYVLMTNRAAGPHRRRKNVPDPFFRRPRTNWPCSSASAHAPPHASAGCSTCSNSRTVMTQ